jgi:predicted XRE-type DNA-binding protein
VRPPRKLVARNLTELAEVLGLSPAQAAEIEVRSDLCDKLISVALREGLTHARIAQLAGTSRTRVTAILNHNLQGISPDLLLRILGSLGYRARITLSKAKPAA